MLNVNTVIKSFLIDIKWWTFFKIIFLFYRTIIKHFENSSCGFWFHQFSLPRFLISILYLASLRGSLVLIFILDCWWMALEFPEDMKSWDTLWAAGDCLQSFREFLFSDHGCNTKSLSFSVSVSSYFGFGIWSKKKYKEKQLIINRYDIQKLIMIRQS